MKDKRAYSSGSIRKLLGAAAAVTVACLAAAALLLVNNGVLETAAGLWPGAMAAGPAIPGDGEGESLPPEAPPADIVFARPDAMKGTWLSAGVDYATSEEDTGETVKAQLDQAFEKIAALSLNTVLVPLWDGDRPLYESALGTPRRFAAADGAAFDPLAYILQCARDRGLFVYGVLDLRIGKEHGADPTGEEGLNAVRALAAEAASAYRFDGFLIDGAGYPEGRGGDFADYMRRAPGMGFEAYQRESVSAAVRDAVAAIKEQDANYYVGLLADPVWANAADREGGSDTKNVTGSLTGRRADTRAWVEEGVFDFVMVKDDRTLEDGNASFGTVLSWWASLCRGADVPFYVVHAATRAAEAGEGWKSPDQLARQVLACQKADGWSGSAFDSLAALLKDTGGGATAALRAFRGEIDEEYVSRTLTFTTPEKTSLTTYESTISIRGSADPNFPLTMNGKAVELSDHGFFSLDLSLSVGSNTYTFEHKGQTVTYTIHHRVVVIKSVEPSTRLALEGGTTITVSAIAHKDSTVSARVNGTTVAMKPAPIQSEEGGKIDSDYVNYAGEYTLPAGIEGKEQNLGAVVVSGSYSGMSESKTGGTLVVNPLPVTPPAPPPTPGGDVTPVDPSAGGETLTTGKILMVSRDYAETFSGTTTDDWSRPVNAYLPKGTLDVVVKSAYDSASKNYYYVLGCGRRVYQKDAVVYKNSGAVTANTMTLAGLSTDGGATTLAFDASWNVPYNVRLLPQNYGNEATQNYNISAFTAQYVDLTFSYTTAFEGTPNLSNSAVFRSAEWIKGTGNTYTLRLYLRNTGAFSGYSVGWGDNARLTFTFYHPEGVASEDKPLSGKRIVLDPGHGGNSIGTGNGSIGEKTLTLKYALLLRDKLQALGATVVMTRTTDVNPDNSLSPPSMDARTAYARSNGTDLFLSIHMDGNTNSSMRGCTVFYFNEYSQPYARALNSRVAAVYKSFAGRESRGMQWMNFHVMRLHDCPSVLVECGFMTNKDDLELLISSGYQEKFTTALADGVVDYFRSMGAYAARSTPQAVPVSMQPATPALLTPAYALERRKLRA